LIDNIVDDVTEYEMGETITRMGRKGNMYSILVGKFKEILQTPRVIRDDNIKVDFNKTTC
jgi:hypothetical protein